MTLDPVRALATTRMEPFWLDDLGPVDRAGTLTSDAETDLLVVGGGFTGLWAAVQALEARPDRELMLIEADRIAGGASGRPGAIVSTSVMHGLANAVRTFPADIDALEALGRDNMAGFRTTLERHAIDARAEWNGELTVAVSPGAVADVEREYRLHADHGHDVTWLDREALQAQIRSPIFEAAAWIRSLSGTLHPARLADGLARAARDLGVTIHEGTPMTALRPDGDAIVVTTPRARIRARRVLLATNAFPTRPRRIRGRVAALRDRILVTEPLDAEGLARVGWQHRQGVYDTRTQLNYMRLTPDDRILFGGKLAYAFGGRTSAAVDSERATYASLAAAFARTFPQLDDIRFSHAWSGPIALTTRMAVHFQRYHRERVVYVGGYSGFGVSASRFGARLALALLDGEDHPALRLAFARGLPRRIPPEPLRWLGALITLHALDTADARGGWRRPWLRMVESMGFPLT